MKKEGSTILLSASDLSAHIACRHLTDLNLNSLNGLIKKQFFEDPTLELLKQRGMEFEQKYLHKLRSEGRTICAAENNGYLTTSETIEAMERGFDVIYQSELRMNRWWGRADFLVKVSVPSRLGSWSYEVLDSKLAKETRTGTILQLSLYSEIVAGIQDLTPAQMHVITPEDGLTEHHYRLNDYFAYYRHIKKQLEDRIDRNATTKTYPLPCNHCMICDWWKHCDDRRRADDHLSLVAGLSNSHSKEINRWPTYTSTLEKFAKMPSPLPHKPSRGSLETYERLKEQARVQLESRITNKPVYECLELTDDKGLYKLPDPSPGDLFFDFEGDPFAGTNGLEYLFGWVENDTDEYKCLWAFTAEEEKAAFGSFIDMVMLRWKKHPDMHIYHFTAYEPSALKRLMGRYAIRESEVDMMLRACIFIDLHTITKQSIRAGVEKYSLKDLERLHDFHRGFDLRDASKKLRSMESFIERNDIENIPQETKDGVAWYNKEDCISTKRLRDWLEQIRLKIISEGHSIKRPELKDGKASDKLTQHQQRVKELYDNLTSNIDVNKGEQSNEDKAYFILGNMLDWYRREDKPTLWEYFRMCEMPTDELLEESSAIAYLSFTGRRTPVDRSVIDVYSFPPQEFDVSAGDELKDNLGNSFGKVAFIDKEEMTIGIRKGPSILDVHPLSIFQWQNYRDGVKEEAIIRIATWVNANGIDTDGAYRAGRDLLLGHLPRTKASVIENAPALDTALDWVHKLEYGVLPIQGPPGSGKSHAAALMIVALVQKGKKVGITAMAHKVISNLLAKVVEVARKQGVTVVCARKITSPQVPILGVVDEANPARLADDLRRGVYNVAAGTAWQWAREDMEQSVDVLFVDEAGQLSLIDTLAVSQSAKNLVLLGDPQQLKQPQQGSHPNGTEVSALEHVLKGEETIQEGQGIFLDKTWRMHPKICKFISELFYEGRLHPVAGLERQRINGHRRYSGAGIWYEAVEHGGNQSHSTEEVERVREIVGGLLNGNVTYTNRDGCTRPLTVEDIKVIAPYNRQVNELSAMLPQGIQVGTVDKFQGQESPVVIFSMATSSPEDAPRGMEFLYSLNRMNVAVSRAKAVFILVASPRLFEPECKSVEQMKLANVFCRLLEVAKK